MQGSRLNKKNLNLEGLKVYLEGGNQNLEGTWRAAHHQVRSHVTKGYRLKQANLEGQNGERHPLHPLKSQISRSYLYKFPEPFPFFYLTGQKTGWITPAGVH